MHSEDVLLSDALDGIFNKSNDMRDCCHFLLHVEKLLRLPPTLFHSSPFCLISIMNSY